MNKCGLVRIRPEDANRLRRHAEKLTRQAEGRRKWSIPELLAMLIDMYESQLEKEGKVE